jgi:mercuric ion transport protein
MDGVSGKKVEVLYFEGCPNHYETAALAREVIGELGIDATVEEVEVRNGDDAERLRFLGSPTVHVDGIDIEVAARDSSQYAFACRTYGNSGVPPRELLAAALNGAPSSELVHSTARGGNWRRSVPTAAGAVALLIPVGTCPACFPAYAAVLSSLGLGFLLYERYLLPIAAAVLVAALGSLLYRARSRRGYGPFLVGLMGSAAALAGKFSLASDALLYGGLSVLVVAATWNAWPKQDAPGSCAACAPQDVEAEAT